MSRIFPLPGVDEAPWGRPAGATLILEQLTEVGENAPPNVRRMINEFRNAVGRFYDLHSRPPQWHELAREAMKPELDELKSEVERLTRMLAPK
jgi:hypothetical protein